MRLHNKPNRFFERMNALLRGDYFRSDSDMLRKYADIISEALKKHETEHNLVCYRGIDVNPLVGIDVSGPFTFRQFISTSVIKTKSFDREYRMTIYVPIGIHGAYIERISAYPKQREFLLDRDCIYRLCNMTQKTIFLEVLE